MPAFIDLADHEEDFRIGQIGHAAMVNKITVSFVTDSEPGKADRYISKLQERFPGIRIIARGDGPVADTVWVKVGPPVN